MKTTWKKFKDQRGVVLTPFPSLCNDAYRKSLVHHGLTEYRAGLREHILHSFVGRAKNQPLKQQRCKGNTQYWTTPNKPVHEQYLDWLGGPTKSLYTFGLFIRGHSIWIKRSWNHQWSPTNIWVATPYTDVGWQTFKLKCVTYDWFPFALKSVDQNHSWEWTQHCFTNYPERRSHHIFWWQRRTKQNSSRVEPEINMVDVNLTENCISNGRSCITLKFLTGMNPFLCCGDW